MQACNLHRVSDRLSYTFRLARLSGSAVTLSLRCLRYQYVMRSNRVIVRAPLYMCEKIMS